MEAYAKFYRMSPRVASERPESGAAPDVQDTDFREHRMSATGRFSTTEQRRFGHLTLSVRLQTCSLEIGNAFIITQ